MHPINLLEPPNSRHTIVGIVSSCIGIIIIISASFIFDAELNLKIYKHKIHIPMLIMIIGIIFQSLQSVYEEKLLSKIETSTYRFVGLKGFYGFFFVMMAQIFFLFVFMCCEPASKAGMFFQSINAGASIALLMKSNELLYSSFLCK